MNRTPLIIAIGLLLVPVLYVGSYIALVTPFRGPVVGRTLGCGYSPGYTIRADYRTGDLSKVFWLLERIDCQLRPEVWTNPRLAELERQIQQDIRELEEAQSRVRSETLGP